MHILQQKKMYRSFITMKENNDNKLSFYFDL